MSKRRQRTWRGAGWIRAVRRKLWSGFRWSLRRLGLGYPRIPVEVLITDRSRRRALERELRAGLKRLQRVLVTPLPSHVAVVVQQVIRTDRQLAGCYQVSQSREGARLSLIRLSLQVNGRRASTDELLAALAEQCIGLAAQQGGGPSVLVPVEFEP